MKKIILAVLVCLLTADLSMAQMSYTPKQLPSDDNKAALNVDDEDDMSRRRRRGRRGRGGSNLNFTISPAFSLGLPIGDLADANKTGFGASVDALYFMDQLGFGLYTGYHSLPADAAAGISIEGMGAGVEIDGSTNFIPILPEVIYLFGTDEFKPYGGLGLGIYSITSKGTMTGEINLGQDPFTGEPITMSMDTDYDDSSTEFGLSPVFGMMYSLSDQVLLKADARMNMMFVTEEYEDINGNVTEESTTYNYIGINLGITINLGG